MALKFIRLKFNDQGELVKALPTEEGINCVEVIEQTYSLQFPTTQVNRYFNDLSVEDSDNILREEINLSKSTNKSNSFILAIQTKGVYKLAINLSCLFMELCRNNKNPQILGFQKFDIPTINSQKEIHSMNQLYIKLDFTKAASTFNPTSLTTGQLYIKQGNDYYTASPNLNYNSVASHIFYHRNVSEFKDVDNILCKSNFCGIHSIYLASSSGVSPQSNYTDKIIACITSYDNNYVLSLTISNALNSSGNDISGYDNTVTTGYIMSNILMAYQLKYVQNFFFLTNVYFLTPLVNTINKSKFYTWSNFTTALMSYRKDGMSTVYYGVSSKGSINVDLTLREVTSIESSNMYYMVALNGKVHNYYDVSFGDKIANDIVGILIHENFPSRKNGVIQGSIIGNATEVTYKYIQNNDNSIKIDSVSPTGYGFIDTSHYNTENNLDYISYGCTLSNLKDLLYYNVNDSSGSKNYKYNTLPEYNGKYDNNDVYMYPIAAITSSTPNVALSDSRASSPINFSDFPPFYNNYYPKTTSKRILNGYTSNSTFIIKTS